MGEFIGSEWENSPWNIWEKNGGFFLGMGGTSPRKKRGCHYDLNYILMIVVEVLVIQKL